MISWPPSAGYGCQEIRAKVAGAELIVASELTLIECERVLIRATAMGLLAEAAAADRRARLLQAAD